MILAAGFGRRLRPLTDRVPKPLIAVGGKPLIVYSLALLRAAGIHEVIINLHHRGDEIRAALGNGAAYDMSICYSEEEPILDTGGGIKQAQPFLGGGRFVVLNSDSIMELDLARVVEWHQAHGALATMVLRPDRDAARYGIIEIDAAHRIRRFLGQPATVEGGPLTPLMFAGVHVFEPDVFEYMPTGAFGINRQTYPAMLAAGRPLVGYRFDGYWRVLDTHAGLAEGRWEVETTAVFDARHRS
jgi:NDP-sugar pyrophosphorylase family protein